MHITIAFAGNRHHPNLHEITAELTTVLNKLEEQTLATSITLLNGLADGADRIAQDTFNNWVSQRATTKITEAILPFAVDDYLKAIDDKEHFTRLLSTCSKVIALQGTFAEAGPQYTAEQATEIRNTAYQQQADYMLNRCNLLIAAIDLTATGKSGGTLDTIVKAQKKGLPVIRIALSNTTEKIKTELLEGHHDYLNAMLKAIFSS